MKWVTVFAGVIVRRVIACNRVIMFLWRRLLITTAYPDCIIARDVCIESGVTIKASDGGRIVVGQGVHISSGAMIVAKGGLVMISNNTFIGRNSIIVSRESVRLGKSCLVAERVSIRDQNHGIQQTDRPFSEQPFTTSKIEIGDNVWVGAGSVILKGVTLESDCVIAANAAVTRDVKSWTVAGGVPAFTIKEIPPTEAYRSRLRRYAG